MCKLIQLNYIILAVILAVNCENDCGTMPAGALSDNTTSLPWQAGVYKNSKGTARFLDWWSGATLVSNNAVLTAAHKVSFYQTAVRPASASSFSIGVGAQPWTWVEPEDITSQYIQVIGMMAFISVNEVASPFNVAMDLAFWALCLLVASIHLAPGFHYSGSASGVSSYGDDIAVLIGTKPFIFTETIRPVCLNFDYDFERRHLKEETEGKAAIWASKEWHLDIVQYLEVATLHPVNLKDCLSDEYTDSLDPYSVKIVTLTVSDKICFAAETNTSVPCLADEEGVGISYPAEVDGVERYYFWGVFSVPLNDDDYCETEDSYYLFTPILRFESFLKKLLYPADVPQNKCIIPPPPYPEHGSYTSNITREKNTSGGKEYELETLTVTCEPGYGVVGPSTVSCFNGYWLQGFPKCVRMCALKPHPSVTYACSGSIDGVCSPQVPPGTLVSPRCNAPNYRSAAPLPLMSCSEDGYWDYVARCVADCGKVTPQGTGLVFGGMPAMRGELPWHVGVYRKTFRPYQQVCGGSLISTTVVISAAHCFWSDLEKQLPVEQFAVAAGKLYRAWDDPADDAQKSDVKTIHLPARFQGSASNYQDDIAVLEVTTSFQYRPHVRPVCLSFDSTFDRVQLQANNKGKVAGWGLTSANGSPSPVLRTVELPYVDVGTCIVESPPHFREYITSDKICAGGDAQSTFGALCKGDSGGGLSFPGAERGLERYYLRGVVSTAPNNNDACNTASFTSFTTITKHQDFIKKFLNDN